MDLEQLIQDCKQYKKDAQKQLFMQYKDALFRTSLKYCKNEVEAEDNLHDAFVTIFEKIRTFKGKGSFEGWMQRITINQAISKYKAKKPEVLLPDQSYFKDDLSVSSEEVNIQLNALLGIIQELPDQYRMVFNLYELDNYSHKEISSMLGISNGTSKSNLHRAKQILKTKILAHKKLNLNVSS